MRMLINHRDLAAKDLLRNLLLFFVFITVLTGQNNHSLSFDGEDYVSLPSQIFSRRILCIPFENNNAGLL